MGKFMRKAKLTAEVSLMEISKSTLGVRTRAKTLALQRLQSAALDSKPDYCYLQLRSRRLEKPPLFSDPRSHGRRDLSSGPDFGPEQTTPQLQEAGQRALSSGSVDGFQGLEDEQFGENSLDFEPTERAIRESTPSNLIRDEDNISSPISSTKYPSLTAENQRPQSSILANIPSTREVDDLFSHFEQQQQRFFMEKYNFDIINDMPLPGRYEWVQVNP